MYLLCITEAAEGDGGDLWMRDCVVRRIPGVQGQREILQGIPDAMSLQMSRARNCT